LLARAWAKKLKSNIETYVIGKVRDKRLELNLSQEDVASILDTSRGFVGQVESNNYPAKYNLNHLNKLAIEFGCQLHDFIPQNPLPENQSKKKR
jgi:transcriptional regulator with XRE-family HTH domain